MVLVTEDGTGLANAESYISVDDGDTYWSLRASDPAFAAWDGGTVAEKEEALRVSTQELDAENEENWKGDKATAAQALDWPRFNAFDSSGNSIDGTAVPPELEALTVERASRYIDNITDGIIPDQASPVGGIEREKLKAGPVEIDTTFSGGAGQAKGFPKLDTLLKYLIDGDGSTIIRS